MKNLLILAQSADPQTVSTVTSEPVTAEQTTTTAVVDSNPAPQTSPARKTTPLMQFLPLILIVVFVYLLMFRGPRKKQQEHTKMLQNLKKNDRVRTIGGILGTIVDIKDDDITLKIDESNNTKIHITSSAIGKNLSQKP